MKSDYLQFRLQSNRVQEKPQVAQWPICWSLILENVQKKSQQSRWIILRILVLSENWQHWLFVGTHFILFPSVFLRSEWSFSDLFRFPDRRSRAVEWIMTVPLSASGAQLDWCRCTTANPLGRRSGWILDLRAFWLWHSNCGSKSLLLPTVHVGFFWLIWMLWRFNPCHGSQLPNQYSNGRMPDWKKSTTDAANQPKICRTMFHLIVFNPNYYIFPNPNQVIFFSKPNQPQHFLTIKTARQEYFEMAKENLANLGFHSRQDPGAEPLPWRQIHGCTILSGYSLFGCPPFIPMKAVQWGMKPNGLSSRV